VVSLSNHKKILLQEAQKIDEFVKSLKMRLSVIPAKAGIQFFQIVICFLDSGFHLSARHRQAGVTTFYEIIKIDFKKEKRNNYCF